MFFQDEIAIAQTLSLTLGSKFEHNAYTGFEYEPSAQLVWTPTKRHSVWGSVARAIRQPARADTQIRIDQSTFPLPGGLGFGLVVVSGNPHPQAEQLHDFEIGYRSQINRGVSLAIATFSSFYRHLQTNEPGTPFFTLEPGPPHLVVPLMFDFKAHAHTYGAEAFINWSVNNHWKLSPGYSLLHISVLGDPTSLDPTIGRLAGRSPKHQYQLRSSLNLRRNVDWDSSMAYVSRLATGSIRSYTRVDTRLGWLLGEFVEVSVTGQNLLSPGHFEFADGALVGHTLVERSVFGKVSWRF
jgi:iron complex outermembrane receptor protein